MKAFLIPFVVIPFACAAPVDETPRDASSQCNAQGYAGLVGANIAAVTLPASPDIRAYSVDDMVTQDFVPGRTNIVYGTDGIIQRVFCG